MINIGAVISGRYEIIEKVGTGGMASKIAAAMIAANSGADMVITNANNVENACPALLHRVAVTRCPTCPAV